MSPNDREAWAHRRAAFFDAMAAARPSAVAVLPSAPVFVRNNDVEHEYRQDSDFFYLTGFDEPESVVVLDAKERKTTFFVRPRDREREVWDGPRAGRRRRPKALRRRRGVRHRRAGREAARISCRTGAALTTGSAMIAAFDERVLGAIDRVRARARSGRVRADGDRRPGSDPPRDAPPQVARRGRDDAGGRADHARGPRARDGARPPGMREYEVEALLLDTFRRHGSERPAYGSIVGSGPNACVLHYRKNDRRIERGELLLIDAGCEYGYYASDVTRTFPVGRAFSSRAAGHLRAGPRGAARRHRRVACRARRSTRFTRGAWRSSRAAWCGWVSSHGEVEQLIETRQYKRFFMHRTSHWLGMDVHDVGAYFVDGKPRTLEPGMVLTVEPGIYIAPDDATVPAPVARHRGAHRGRRARHGRRIRRC